MMSDFLVTKLKTDEEIAKMMLCFTTWLSPLMEATNAMPDEIHPNPHFTIVKKQDSWHIFAPCVTKPMDVMKEVMRVTNSVQMQRQLQTQVPQKATVVPPSSLQLSLPTIQVEDTLPPLMQDQTPCIPVKACVETRKERFQRCHLRSSPVSLHNQFAKSKEMPVSEQQKTRKNSQYIGKLSDLAVMIFCKAYGLNGYKKEDHELLIARVIQETKCSRKAVAALLYGTSYAKKLQQYRNMVVDYQPQRDLEHMDPSKLPFYYFDAQQHSKPASDEKTKSLFEK